MMMVQAFFASDTELGVEEVHVWMVRISRTYEYW
jgi:hypothetical protein